MFGKLITAIITPFNNSDQIDYRSLHRIIDHVYKTGSQSIVVGGSTGEGHLLTISEKLNLLQASILFARGRMKVIGAISENSTKGALELLSLMNHLELDGVLVSPPSYVLPNQEGIFKYYKKLNSISKLNLIIYNVPKRVGVKINKETILRLRQNCDYIIGLKEASEDLESLKYLKEKDPELLIYGGVDSLLLEILQLGGQGIISVGSNAFGNDFIDIINDFENKVMNIEHQRYFKILTSILEVDTNPIVIKYIMTRLGLSKNLMRLPLCPLNELAQEKINLLLGF